MALDNSKSGFGFDMEERLKKVTSTQTLTSTSTSTPMRENRSRRLYATVKPSTFEKLETYAAERGDKVNNVVNKIIEDFFEANNDL